MKKHIGKMFGTLKKSPQLARAQRRRRLQLESLEGRRLLTADFAAYQNPFIAEDVNADFKVSAIDALLVINALNEGGSRSFAEGEIESGLSDLLDTNGDNFLSAMDVLTVVNRLNGEGEDPPGTFLSYSYQITDTSGVPLTSSVVVGDTFRINVFVKDVRPPEYRTITDPTDPNYVRFNGVFAAANDLGVSDLDLVTFQTPTSFFSGVRFGPEFFNDQGALRGGGIQISGGQTPTLADGQTFTLDSGSGPVTFEFDFERTAAVGSGNVAIPLRNPVPFNDPNDPTDDNDPVVPLTFEEVTSAMLTAIGNSSLGITPVNRGGGVIGIPNEVLFNPGTTLFTRSLESVEFLNEVKGFLDGSRSPDPDGDLPFYSVDFTAEAPGSVVFTPNGPERPGSENLVFGSRVVIPNEVINFGMPFTIEIISDPTAPVAVADNLSTAEDTSLVIGANATGNDTVTAPRTIAVDTVSAIPNVTLGSISGNTYVPPTDFFGTDRIVYTVVDSTGLKSGPATITINVTPVNDEPNAFNDTLSVEEDSTANTLEVLADNGNGADNAGPSNETGDSISITGLGVANAQTLTTANGASVSIASGGTSLIYSPVAGFIGTDSFTYTITDAGGLTDTATVTVEVEPGVLPRARTDRASGAENTAVEVAVLANDSVNPGATAQLVSFTQGAHGAVAASTTDPSVLVYTPTDPNFFGTDTFTYTINDTSELGADSTATVTITITDINDVPVLEGDTASATEDTAVTIAISTLLANDSPGAGENQGVAQVPQSLAVTSVAAVGGGGSVAIVGANVVYTPAADFNGEYLFTYTAQDNGSPALSATATVTVNVAAVNDNPIAVADTASTDEDTGVSISASTVLSNDRPGPATAIDEAGQTLSVTGVSSSSAQGGTVSFADATITYTPLDNFSGQDTFTYSISDGAGGTATGTITVTVVATNDPPTTVADTANGFRDVPVVINAASLTTNDSPGGPDEASQTLTVTAVRATSATSGTVSLSAGTITFTPAAGFTGPTSFEYTVQDSGGASSTGTVNVQIAEFVPSTISGNVWLDDDSDGGIDSTERDLGGIVVTLHGTTAQGQALPVQTLRTLADGSYSFEGLGPGRYSVEYSLPGFLQDSTSSPDGRSISISDPRGTNSTGNNFSVAGLDLASLSAAQEAAYQLIISQFASSRTPVMPIGAAATDIGNLLGTYFAIGADNTQYWSASPAGSVNVWHTEAVLSGNQLLLTVVDADLSVSTTTLGPRDFVKVQDAAGNALIAILKVPNAFQPVDRATPPFSAEKYLESVDAIFEQEGWDD